MKYLQWARPIFVGVTIAFVSVAAPASAKKFDADNAKRVDGFAASKYTDSASKRKGKLVATNKQGLLPNNIVALVQDAEHASTAESAQQAAMANLAQIADDLSCTSCVGASELQSANPPTAGQILGFDGTGLAWQAAGGSGTVTSVGSGTGLAGGPVTSSGTLSLAPEYRLPQGCGTGQVAKSDGSGGWTCADDSSANTTSASVAGTVQTNSTAYVTLSAGPTETVTVPSSGKAMVTITAGVIPTTGNIAYMSATPTGSCSNTSDSLALAVQTDFAQESATYLFTGLTPGSHTFTACYRVNGGGDAQYFNRNLIVQPVS